MADAPSSMTQRSADAVWSFAGCATYARSAQTMAAASSCFLELSGCRQAGLGLLLPLQGYTAAAAPSAAAISFLLATSALS